VRGRVEAASPGGITGNNRAARSWFRARRSDLDERRRARFALWPQRDWRVAQITGIGAFSAPPGTANGNPQVIPK